MREIFKLDGKIAIVWGGGQGMGERSAVRLAEAGCDVAVVDIDVARAQNTARLVQELGRRALALAADVTDEAQVIAALDAAEAGLGPIDTMVTVVGMAQWSPLVDMTLADWQLGHDLNLKSFFLTARAVARSMIKGGRPGTIVAVASLSGLTSAPNHGSYGAAKAGVANLVHTMALEWGPAIRVNAIAPGSIITPRVIPSPAATEMMQRRLPLARSGTTDEVAKTALFLASDLSSYVTGQTLALDGGWTSAFLMDPKH